MRYAKSIIIFQGLFENMVRVVLLCRTQEYINSFLHLPLKSVGNSRFVTCNIKSAGKICLLSANKQWYDDRFPWIWLNCALGQLWKACCWSLLVA